MKNIFINIALSLSAILIISGCGDSSSDSSTKADPLELESDGKSLLFYSTSTNEHYSFDVDSEQTTNLQNTTDAAGHDISNLNMSASENGRLFSWGGKAVIMFKQDYSFADDGNATWEDFYYLGHYHSHEENNVTSYFLAAHDNDEFNVTSGGKFNAMIRLNTYLAEQYSLEQNLSSVIPSDANGLCGFHTFVNENNETSYYAVGNNGTMYVYDENITTSFIDSVVISDSCSENEFGMSSTEDGVLFFSAHDQKIHSIDSHGGGIYHIHSSWDLSQLIGSGRSAQMMVGLDAPVAP